MIAFIRASGPAKRDLDAGVGEDRVEQRRACAVPVANEEAGAAAGFLQVHSEIACGLPHPALRWGCGGARIRMPQLTSMTARMRIRAPGEGQRFEEVSGEDGLGLRTQEGWPTVRGPLGCRVDPGICGISQTVDGAASSPKASSEDLGVFGPVTHQQQPQHRKRVGHAEAHQSQ
jgi:hypothetical protein